MNMTSLPKPSDIKNLETPEVVEDVVEAPKPKAAPKKPSAPVRNPAFREHEGLKALQRELHRSNRSK